MASSGHAGAPSTAEVPPGPVDLSALSVPNLRCLAASQAVDLGALRVTEGALPPMRPVARALAQLELGTPAFWCVPFLIVCTARATVVGACGFKTRPVEGSVEISYGLAPAERGRGFATLAVTQLLRLAASSGLVREAVAHILPSNIASAHVATRLGFKPEGLVSDPDGEIVTRWVWEVAS